MEAFESDDDFGDLYTDVEAQASSAIDGVQFSATFRNDSVIVDEIGRNEKPSSDEENELDDFNGSESEDDLNIVLNDEDCKSNSAIVIGDEDKNEDLDGFIVTNDDKCIKTCGPSNPRDAKVNSSVSIKATGEWSYQNDRGRYNELHNLGTSQRRCFKLPWYRSILDVNIDAFEEKPWRNSGADITDYFNFGFNEDGWKNYCNSVDQLRLSALVPFGNRNNVSCNQDYEAGHSEQLEDPMLENDFGTNGRAIQVEDGDSERQPTMVAKRPPRNYDTDVVIEINLEKPVSDTDGKQNRSSSETSNCVGGMGNDVSVGFMEGKDEKPFRCSAKKTSSNPMPDDQCMKFSSSEEVEEAEAEPELLLLEEEDQLSLFSSCFESDSDASGDRSYIDRGNSVSPMKRSSVNSGRDLWEHDSSHQKNSKGNNEKVKPVDPRGFSRSRSPDHDERRKNNFTANFSRHKGKFRDFAYYKESELFLGSSGRESAENRWHIAPRSCGKVIRGFRRDCNPYTEGDRNERRNLCEDERQQHRPSMKPVAYIETEHHLISRYTQVCEDFDSRSNRNYNRMRFRKSEDRDAQCRDRDQFIRERDHFDRSNAVQSLKRGKRFRDGYTGTTDFSFTSHQLYRDFNRLKEDEYCENLNARYSFQRSYENCEDRWTDTMSLTNGVPDLRSVEQGLRKVCSRENGDTFSKTIPIDRKRGFARRSKVLPSTNEEVIVGVENPYLLSKNHRRLRRGRDSIHGRLHIDDMELHQLGSKNVRRDETDRRSIRKSDRGDCRVKNEQAVVPMDMSVGEGKLSGRCREDGDSGVNSKVNPQDHDVFDIEEGQIVSEDCKRYRERIMESLEKMEKRRERFEKQPIINVERDKCLKTDEIFVDTPQPNRDRPARKRRWC